MARQQGIIRFTGRLGNTVGYLAKDGKGNSFDASRVLAAQVTNPQTIAQMDQRMKMAPVVNFYRGLRGILDHSWQSVKYGEPSRLFFYSQTLRNLSTAGVPYIVKGDKKFVPWAFPISSGSLPVTLPTVVNNPTASYLEMTIESARSLDNATTVADLTEELSSILGVKAGQQLTFIFVCESNGQYIPAYARVILSTTDETALTSLGILISGGVDETIKVSLYGEDSVISQNVVASGIIVSELVGGVWQRNNATMAISESLRSTYNSQAAYDAMLASYRQTSNSRESDWYLNGGGEESSSTVATVKEVTVTANTGEKTIGYFKVGATKYAPYYTATSEGQVLLYGYRKGGDMAFTKTGANTLGGFAAEEDIKTEYLSLGYTLCTRAELLALAPDLTIPE